MRNDLYILACAPEREGGGIYRYAPEENGSLSATGYFACDRPMYAVRREGRLFVLLRQVFGERGAWFSISEDFHTVSPLFDTKGVVPCHLDVLAGDVYVVNYLSGNLVKNSDGVLIRKGQGKNPARQSEPHTHFVAATSDGNLALCDLGTDALVICRPDLTPISEARVPAGYGIRHLVFSHDGAWIYAINELVPSVSVFRYQMGRAFLASTLPLATKNPLASGAAIRLSESGEQLFVSLREENVIVTLSVNGAKVRELSRVSAEGDSPRDFDVIDGAFAVICNEKSNNVAVKRVANGVILPETLSSLSLPAPLCVVK